MNTGKTDGTANPLTQHLFVMDRMNDMQFTMNMARPAAKAIVAVTAAAVVALLLFVAAVILNFENAEVTFVRENDTITIEAAGYDCKFAVDEVESAELIGRLPDDDKSERTEVRRIGMISGTTAASRRANA